MEFTAAFIRQATQVLGKRLNLQNDSFVSERSQLGPDYSKAEFAMYDKQLEANATSK